MIISRTPLRISFVGGGTDIPAYYKKYGGEVINTAIDKYIYVTVNKKFDGKVHLRYSKTEQVKNATELQHSIVKACMKLVGVKTGVEIVTISDVPMKGTGLGSSSSLTVGLLNALTRYKGKTITSHELAGMACHVEIDLLKSPIGKQDQYAAAYGGFNHFVFKKNGKVVINNWLAIKDIIAPENSAYATIEYSKNSEKVQEKIKWLQNNTLLFHLNMPREANHILGLQTKEISNKERDYTNLKAYVKAFEICLRNNSEETNNPGNLIDATWQTKKKLCSQISSGKIDKLYDRARYNGALGGKVCGAGGGGFLMLIVPKDKQSDVIKAMKPLHELPFKFEPQGSVIIYEDRN